MLTILTATVTAATTLVVWHGLLFDQWREAPVALAGWLVLLGAAGLALRRQVIGGRGASDTRLPEGSAIALTGFSLVLVYVFQYGNVGILSDARDYFVQVRSLVIDLDLRITPGEIARMSARGDALHYPIGSALLWAPFVAACHAYLWVLNLIGADHVRDGYTQPYAVAAGLGTLVYGVVALRLIVGVLRRYFSDPLPVVAAIALYAGSFVGWYLTVEPVMTHGTSLFAVTLFLYLWHESRETRGLRQWIGLGAAAGLMALVRWQEALFALVLAADAFRDYWRIWRQRAVAGWLPAMGRHAAGAVAVLVTLLPQFWLWQSHVVGAGSLAEDEFAIRRFDLDVANVLFSPNHGLLTWTPIISLALLGLVPFVRRAPRFGLVLAAGFAAQVYVNGLLQVWWGGSGFGARRFMGCALVFAVGLAAAIDWLRGRPRVATALILVPLLVVNTALMLEVHSGRLPNGEGLTAGELLSGAYRRLGNPFSFPANWIFSRTHRGESPATYDELGRRAYRNLRVDVGDASDDPFLTYGWSDPEQVYDVSFRWAVGREAGVALPLRQAITARLLFFAEPFNYEGAPPQIVEVVINGTSLATLPMDRAWREYDVPVAGTILNRNLNHLELRFAYAASPLDLGLSGDARVLAARIDYIELRRGPGDDPPPE